MGKLKNSIIEAKSMRVLSDSTYQHEGYLDAKADLLPMPPKNPIHAAEYLQGYAFAIVETDARF